MKRRLMFSAAVVAASVFATAVPAHAVTVFNMSDSRSVSVTVNTCAANAATGTACFMFVIGGGIALDQNGVNSSGIGVDAFDAVKAPDGSFSATHVSDGALSALTAGQMTIDRTASTGRVRFTVTLNCDAPGCDLAGSFTFDIRMKRSALSEHNATSVVTEAVTPVCNQSNSTVVGATTHVQARGTVKAGGRTRAVRARIEDSTVIVRSLTTVKQIGTCL